MAVFHQGELSVQQRVGVADIAKAIGDKAIRAYMPEQHRTFFSQQPLLYAGVLDNQGHPWATPILGEQGFVSSPNSTTLSIEARALIEYAQVAQLSVGDSIGLLGLELTTRRRNRVNGLVAYTSEQALRFEVQQSFGNCPKYIQKRELKPSVFNQAFVPKAADFRELAVSDVVLEQVLRHCDTFFIASRAAALNRGDSDGVDISHRGGKPGFIHVHKGSNGKMPSLVFPDFSGNNLFNTLGNIVADPRVGLYIPDFETGCSFWIKGKASIIWDVSQLKPYPGAQRFVQVSIEQGLSLTTPTLVQHSDIEFSPALHNLS
ncbi:pyridoxamine 5'-phosphate oxidase family protein [Agarivorans sp. MS3-6]|uniref:pyridoxamine 5'-phosphate oxidase family protein n=1 Tax=Agarivorans sp. TSD2052 TaxID=2937286 RepID=UPI00200CF132|nr:pyridoxamine 5'-phosphate oxidase family protein [Agarivorans sp. TSD2052]UPW17512.1 pyridoxamine 5'-phosphate oxidase family protein [Agarivorans sp. TSD2052]